MRKNQEIGALLLRLGLGITFFAHGLMKFQGGIDHIGMWFQSMGIPSFMAYVVACIEVAGGIAILLGLGTRFVAAFFVCIMIGAILFVKLSAGLTGNGKMPGYEFELSLMLSSLYLVLNGSRFLSLDSIFLKKKGEEREVQNKVS